VADNTRQFTLIGNFTDNITKPLEAVNKSLQTVLEKLERYHTIGIQIKNDFKEVGASVRTLSSDFRDQARAVGEVSTQLRYYKRQLGGANRANKSGGLKFLNTASKVKNNEDLAAARAQGVMLRAQAKATIDLARAEKVRAGIRYSSGGGRGGGGGGGGGGGPVGPGPSGRGRYTGGHGSGFGYGASAGEAFGFTLGNTLSDFLTNAITNGFEIGVKLMALPFQYIAGSLKERIADEMSDIQAAGGLYATDLRKSLGLFKNFGEALRTQEQLNARLSLSARDLPGETAEYVRQAKRLEDTFAKALGQDPAKFQKLGESMGAKVGDKLDSFQVLVQKFTEKAVLLSQGTRGAAGSSGAYGLPQLLEILINKDKVNVQAMETKYVALRDNPLLASALKDSEDKIAATGAGTADRIATVFKILEEALPNEVIQRIRQSTASILETIRSTFLDPETGLFGLGRKLKLTVPRVNEFGQYLTKFGTVTQNASLAAQDTTSIFDLLKNILSGFVLPLVSISDILFELFNPLEGIGIDLVKLRNMAQNFYLSFNSYTKYFEIFAKQINSLNIKQTSAKRGAIAAIGNLLNLFGAISDADFEKTFKELENPNAVLTKITSELFGKLFDSEFMREVGETLGKVVGGALQAVAQFLSGGSKFISSNKFAKGFGEGFDQRKGLEAIKKIFESLVSLFWDALKSVFAVAPLSLKIAAGLYLFLPAITAAIGTALVNGIGGLMARCFRGGGLANMACGAGGGNGGGGRRGGGGGGGGGGFLTGSLTDMRRNRMAALRRKLNSNKYYARLKRAPQFFGNSGYTSPIGPLPNPHYDPRFNPAKARNGGLPSSVRYGRGAGFAQRAGTLARAIPGGALAGGAISGALALASGESPVEAIKTAAFSVIGGVVGSIAGPWGTLAGTALGPVIGDAILNSFQKPATALENAAKAMEQVDKGATKYGDEYAALGTLDATVGGGKGVTKFAEEQLRLGKITQKQADEYKVLGVQLTEANIRLDKYKVADADYLTAKGLAGGKETKLVASLREKRDKAEKEYALTIEAANKRYEGMDLKMQGALLATSTAMKDFAARVYGIKLPGQVGEKPRPDPKKPVPTPEEARKDTLPPVWDDTFGPKPKYIGEKRTDKSGMTRTWNGARWAARGSLGDAVSKEIGMKPAGSSLVVANSSETIIPAAGGQGVGALIDAFRSGLNSIALALKQAQSTQTTALKDINNTLKTNQMQTNTRLMKLETKFTSPGGSLGGAKGGPGPFGAAASRHGLTLTSGYRPGDPGYHGIDRARDYSNSTGPTPQMMAFAQFMSNTYGRTLKELIYTPLGFSIRNGVQVPPYAQGQHYNHVHVAYGLGVNNPYLAPTLGKARDFERAVTPGSVKIASITGRSDEGFGSTTSVTNNIQISQQPGQNAEELASIVVQKIQNAIYGISNSYYS
jgi:hypothetical protein